VYHTESPGIESDVHRFIQQYGISAEDYQEPLLALALQRLQHLRSAAPRRQALAGAPLGEQARVQQGNGFGDDYDDEEEEDDEEEDALEEGNEGGWGDGETHQSESPAPTSPSPRVEEKASRPSIEKKKNLEKRDELTRPPPIEHTRSTISRVDDDVKVEGIGQVKSRGKSSIDQVKEDEDWAEEDAEHDMLPNAAPSMPRPKSAPPQQSEAREPSRPIANGKSPKKALHLAQKSPIFYPPEPYIHVTDSLKLDRDWRGLSLQ